MAIATFPTATQIQSWSNTFQKELIRRSPWEQMSNVVIETQEIPNRDEMNSVPDAVVLKMKGDFDPGSYQLTIPLVGKLNAIGAFGRQPADGTEETPAIKYKAVHYNVERKAISIEEMSVDGAPDKFYQIGSKGTPMLTNYFVELTDFNCHRSIVEGASWALTESQYWNGPSFTAAPQSRKYNPTILARGKSAIVAYNTTVGTHETAIQTYLDTLTTASNPFALAGLDSLIAEMCVRLIPLGWKKGGNVVNYVLLLSDFQCRELQDTTSSTSWSALMRTADAREDKDNRAITGILGVYRETLLINNGRAPAWDTSKAANGYMGYFKPWSAGGLQNAANVAITRAAKTASTVGTCECAIALGKGAIGNPIINNVGFDNQTKDYNFNKGLCGGRMAGWVRLDFDVASPTNSSIQNQTSLLYFSPTPTVVY